MKRLALTLFCLLFLSLVFLTTGARAELRSADMELHLQEGFIGQRVIVLVDGKTIADEASVITKLMLGLAQIIELNVAPGQDVLITIKGDPDIQHSFTVRPDRPFVTVTQTEAGWMLAFPEHAPGYL